MTRLLRIDIKQLFYLIALDKTQHFGQAAEMCHVTQPTLSMRLRNLEKELDVVLIKRSSRFEGFTEEGEKILKWAKTMQSAYDGLQAEAANFRQQLFGQLRIGIVPLTNLNPMLMLQKISTLFPEISFQVLSTNSENIIDRLNSNSLDIGICYLEKANTQQHEIYALKQTELGLLFHRNHFMPSTRIISWHEAAKQPLALLNKENHFRQSVDLAFQRYNLHPKVLVESSSTLHLIQSVNAGFCASIVPIAKGMENLSQDLDVVPIVDATINAPLGIVIRKEEPRSILIEKCFAQMRTYLESTGL
ncbi:MULTISPECIES: LysR family transcriptional regulator [Proteus]|uniref:LysR family transcriptional regulator n=1 Tax=Proteus TaxID=583 RepID=UPI001376D647|nr:LysR family transcriptional regulator [Proteus sp. G2609]EKW1742633.1 LysR family transcriptional regulator [Proteus mirabilis]EKW1744177.1 LysR family transcriptional regulator [Proteus mirabilis]MCT0128519.1 LysR family transcriptional regulator [Proteus mirabilis]NBN67751.1 LysR family transcriptional regulator [Proteus sp. G2609]HCT7328504.1 LysR family transcriptional regulator [Proteus mirabilis]